MTVIYVHAKNVTFESDPSNQTSDNSNTLERQFIVIIKQLAIQSPVIKTNRRRAGQLLNL
jgi:hypothetical protein